MATSKPLVILLNVEQESFAGELMAGQVKALKEHCQLIEATTEEECINLLRQESDGVDVRGVYIASAAILQPKYVSLSTVLAGFVYQGGIVIVGGSMSSCAIPSKFNQWIQIIWDLPWRFGDYHRDDSVLNTGYITSTPIVQALHELPAKINIKSVYLRNVKAPDMVYTMTSSAEAQPPIALKKRGEGYFGWVGDVNYEEPINNIYVAMFGLLKHDDGAEQTNIAASSSVCKSCGKGQDALEAGQQLQRCARCRNAVYCGKECQRVDHKIHKTVCIVRE